MPGVVAMTSRRYPVKTSGPTIGTNWQTEPANRFSGHFGLSKKKLHLDGWLKDVGPTTELRQWFGHDPAKWKRFRARYFRELDSRPESWRPIRTAARGHVVTLIYSSHVGEHNNAVALKAYLEARSA